MPPCSLGLCYGIRFGVRKLYGKIELYSNIPAGSCSRRPDNKLIAVRINGTTVFSQSPDLDGQVTEDFHSFFFFPQLGQGLCHSGPKRLILTCRTVAKRRRLWV
jgi:hypothetical protein